MSPSIRRAIAVAVGLAFVLTACSTRLSTGPTTATTVPTTTTIKGGATPAQTKASDYRAELTYLMVEQVYLLARVTQPAATAPPGAAAFGITTTTSTTAPSSSTTSSTLPPAVAAPTGDAAAALDENSHDISDWLAQADHYGIAFDAAFYTLWSQRIAHFLDYAKAKAGADTTGATAATAALATNATAIAKLVHGVNQYVAVTTVTNPGTGLADELGPDNDAVTTFIDDQAAGLSTAAADVVTAAERMYHTADYLSAAAAKLDAPQYPGTADGTAANLRSSITMIFVEHVELASLELDAIGQGLPEAPWTAVLATNTTELHNAVADNGSDAAAGRLAGLWNAYIGDLTGYARAKASGDQAAAGAAADRLAGVAPAVGAFFSGQSSQLSTEVVSADVAPVINGLRAVADAAATKAPDAILTREACGFVPKLASDIAEAYAIAQPTLYAP